MLHSAALAGDGAVDVSGRTMDYQPSLAERIAAELLRHDGPAVIWQAQVTAATAYREGHAKAADILLKIADAAEEILRRDVEREMSWHRLREISGWVARVGGLEIEKAAGQKADHGADPSAPSRLLGGSGDPPRAKTGRRPIGSAVHATYVNARFCVSRNVKHNQEHHVCVVRYSVKLQIWHRVNETDESCRLIRRP